MKFIPTIVFLLFSAAGIYAQQPEAEHLLDGTSMNYYYQNGTAVHVEFISGQITYQWIAGPSKGSEGTQAYMSRKVGDKMYLVNFIAGEHSTFVTLLFNFNQNVMYSSVIAFPTTADEVVIFDGGIIENLTLIEK